MDPRKKYYGKMLSLSLPCRSEPSVSSLQPVVIDLDAEPVNGCDPVIPPTDVVVAPPRTDVHPPLPPLPPPPPPPPRDTIHIPADGHNRRVYCGCEKYAMLRTVWEEGPNFGRRRYYFHSTPAECRFEAWHDKPAYGHRRLVLRVREEQVQIKDKQVHYCQRLIQWQNERISYLEARLSEMQQEAVKEDEGIPEDASSPVKVKDVVTLNLFK